MLKKLLIVLVLAALIVPVTSVFAQGIKGAGLVIGGVEGEAKALNGGGASFPRPLYDVWFATPESIYTKLTGVTVSYQPQGSGFGIQGIRNQTLDFGASDGAMTDSQLEAAKGGAVLHIPAALGGVVLIYNIPELTDRLQLTAEQIALIYFGDFAADSSKAWFAEYKPLIKWNDERLVANNPGLANVDRLIVPVRRADSSGTTNIYTSYLAAASKEWAEQVGPGANAIRWPTGLAGRQNPGVAAAIAQNTYAIGYVEQSYAAAQGLPHALVRNKSGKYVEATQETVSAAASGVALPDDLRITIVNGEGDNVYPISGFTWLLFYQEQPDAAKGLALARLGWWIVTDGQQVIADASKVTDKNDPMYPVSGYAPLPAPAIEKAQKLLLSMTSGGKALLGAEFQDAVK